MRRRPDLMLMFIALHLLASSVAAQGSDHQHEDQSSDSTLAEQLSELRAKVLRLEKAIEDSPGDAGGMGRHGHGMGGTGGADNGGGMGARGGGDESGGGMGGRGDGMGGMASGGKDDDGMGGMGGMMRRMHARGDMGKMGRMMMGRMAGMDEDDDQEDAYWSTSALPGFPGLSHLYHIGSTNFFLDHETHISLTREQRSFLARIKESARLAMATADRQIEEAEQELWILTSSAEPDPESIESKVREIERLRSNRRLAFIQNVGKAAEILTDEQRRALAGEAATAEAHEED